MTTQLGVFAKHWTPGRVKTRLASSIGETRAAEVAKAFVQAVTSRFAGAADASVLGFTPGDAEEPMRRVVSDPWRFELQADGDLGQRMKAYFEHAFARGHDRAVLIGADSPDLPKRYVQQAFDALERSRLVLGPTEDGGYYLIGAREEPPPVFDAMPWSTDRLWSATVGRLQSAGWRQSVDWVTLPTWYDVDTADDLARLRESLADVDSATLGCELRTLADRLDEILAPPISR